MAWLLLCAMLATSALVYHLSMPGSATPPSHQGPRRRLIAAPVLSVLAAAFPDLPPHMRAGGRPTAVPTIVPDPHAGSLPDSPPIPGSPPQTYVVPLLQPVSLIGATGRQIAISAQLLRRSVSHLVTATAAYLPSTSISSPQPTPGPSQVAALLRPAAAATPRIVYLVVTATPNPSLLYQQAALRSAAQPVATDQSTLVPPTASPSFGHTQQVWITGYIDQGVTATGMQAGPGICAVDPSYIAMGTRIVIDGVGACLAEDTGSAVIGPHIDVWVPTDTDANAITGWHTANW